MRKRWPMRKRLVGDAAIGFDGCFRRHAVRLFEKQAQGLMMTILQGGIEEKVIL